MRSLRFCFAALSGLLKKASAPEPTRPPEPPATKVEKFLARRGSIVVKEYAALGRTDGRYGRLDLETSVVYAPGAEATEKIYGIRFTRPATEKYESDAISFLDYDECADAAAALRFMQKMAAEWASTQREYTEVEYTSRGRVTFGFYQKGTEQAAYAYVGGPIGAKGVFMSADKLGELAKLVEGGVQRLAQMGASAPPTKPSVRK